MFRKKKYSIRHKILEALQKKLALFDGQEYVGDNYLSLEELSNNSKIKPNQIYENIDYLFALGEVHIEWTNNSILRMCIVRNGTISYFDEKYLYEGNREFWNDTYDIIKTISAIVLLLIAISTFAINVLDTRKNKNDIENIKAEINKLKKNSTNLPHSR